MKRSLFNRALSLLLALVCVLGILPLSAFAASNAPAYITQQSADYWRTNGRLVRYQAANAAINAAGRAHVFDAQVSVPGLSGTTRALCSHQIGNLGNQANGQKWLYKQTVDNASLRVLLTYVYSHTNGNFTEAGEARGLPTWGEFWSDLWFITAQTMTWYWEHGLLKDVTTDREGFIEQASEEMVVSFKVLHDVWNYSPWITDWSNVTIHTIIDSKDNGKTGYSAYDYIKTGVDLVLDHPEYYYNYNLWEFDWDKSQPWKLTGQSGTPMQRLLIAVPDKQANTDTVKLTVKKLEAGTNKPLPGVTFSVKSADGSGDFSVTKTTGADGTFTLTSEADGLSAGQYVITEEAVPEGYVAQTSSQTVTVMPNNSVANTFTFYNEPNKKEGDGSIRKVDADNPTVGIPGAVIRITSVKLDDGGSFIGEYTTKDGGYILKEDLDFSKLPKGSFLAEEITPPEGFVLSSDVSKVRQPFVWDGKTDVSLVFENSAKVKVQLQKVDESGSPLAGAVFLVLRDGQIIGTEETRADGTITVSNITEGHYEFVEVAAAEGFDCDKTPVGVHVNAEDLQGEQTIVVTKVNHHKRDLTIQKRDTESGDPIPGTSFHVHGVNLGYEHDVVTGADGRAELESLPSGCYEIEETAVPAPWILDTNNRKTVWIDSEKDKDIVVDFVNSTKPGFRLLKIDQQTGEPLSGVLFRIAEVNGGYDEQHFTDQNGLVVLEGLNPGAYTVQEVKPKNGWVADDTVHTIYLEENKTTTLELSNLRKPDLFIKKVDSITGSPIEGVKFQVWRGSADTKTGEYNDLGTFYTDAQGQIHLERVDTGWYKIKELEPAPGFTIKQPDTQEVYLAAGKDHTVTFENTPKNAIIVEKYDSVTHEALAGCTFQLRYLAGASGTGGTVIGQKVTGKNGVAMWTGLEPGAYVIEEVDPADGYSIINSSETVYLADNGEQSVITVRFDNMPDGLLLVRKVCATNPSITLQNAEFKITYADGTVIGDSNGIYRTDENGEIRIEGLKPGKSVIVTEVKAPAGFIIDTQSQTIQIKEGRTSVLTFKNQPKGKLIIQKRDSATNQPLSGAEFRVTTAAGCEVGLDGVIGTSTLTQNGIFVTDAQGEIRITNLAPGAYVLNEIKAPDGYVMDSPSTNVVIGQGGDTQTVIIKNTPKATLTIHKRDAVTRKPLANAEFIVRDSEGHAVGPANGIYKTGTDGTVVVSGLEPGATIMVSETKAPTGYILDETPKHIVVKSGIANSLVFDNQPGTTLIIRKFIKGTENEPLSGVAFKVVDGSGAAVGPDDGVYYTDKAGEIVLDGIEPGTTVKVREIKTVEGYVLDGTPQDIKIVGGRVQQLTFWNKRAGTLVIEKKDKLTGALIPGAQFQLTYANGGYVDNDNGHLSSNGIYTTDDKGQIRIEGIVGTVVAKEVKAAPGYVIDQSTQVQTVTVNPMDTQTLAFLNEPLCSLTITKLDSVTGKPIPGTSFEVRDGNGAILARCTTGKDGTATVTGLVPGSTVQVVETRVPDGYVLNTTPQVITVTNGANTLTGSSGTGGTPANPGGTTGGGNDVVVENDPKTTLTIQKYVDGTTDPIQGVAFFVTDSSGAVVGPSNGEYVTDRNGRIVIEGLEPGVTITARETRAASGFVLDTTPQSIKIKVGQGQTMTFFNKVEGGLELIKVSESDPTQRIPGTTFEIRKMDGALVETVTTGKDGRVHVNLGAGNYYALEIEAAQGFKLDNTPHYFTVQDGKCTTLTVKNKALSGILIHKTDSVTGKGIQGVSFLLYDAANTPIGQYTSDNQGYVYIEDLTDGGRYYLRELDNPGYIPDTRLKTVYVKAGETTLVEWQNTPITGQIQIKKTSEDYNPMNGWPAGTPIPGTEFEIYHHRTGNLVDSVRTDKNGVAVSKPLPLGRYKIVESKSADFYGLDKTPIEAELEYAGQLVKVAMTNKSLTTNVSIKKTGYAEVMPGQDIRYTFSGIGNNSTTALTSFYWRDTLPVQAVRLNRIFTGTYNAPGNYKVVYKTNLSNGEYRTMYDNLSTSKNYTLDASPTALGLASNEYVTEFMLVFGAVPANFRQVEAPKVDCKVLPTVKGGSSFTNAADVGGVYNGQWIQAVTRWTTKVYGKPPKLPTTGY